MKKGILFAMIMLIAFVFVSCDWFGGTTTVATTTTAATTTEATTAATTTEATTTEATTTEATTTEATTSADTVAPVISGTGNVSIFVDSTFDPLDGVTATDNIDGDLTDQITYVTTLDTSVVGVYYIKYTVEDAAGNKTQVSRYITVEIDPNLFGDELVKNGDFSLGWAVWNITQGLEGGAATATVVDGVLEFQVTGVSGGRWEPRLESNDITFEQGKTYEVSFDAKALAARSVHIQVGELLTGAPWFDDFKEGQTVIFDLSTEWQTFTFKFTMTEATNEHGKLLFENGTVEGGVGVENLLTTIYYDNIMIEEAEADPDTQAPVINGVEDVTIEVGTPFDALEGVTVSDNLDVGLEITAEDVTGTVDSSVAGTYTLTYTISDAAGNVATEERIVTVVALMFSDAGVLVNGDFENALGDPAEWYLYEANYDGGPGTDGTMTIANGELVLEVVNIGSWGYQGWLLQATQDVDFVVGQTYKVTFDAKAAAAREFKFAAGFSDASYNWHGYGELLVNLTTEYQTFEYIFTVTEDNMEYVDQFKFEFGQAGDTVYLDNVTLSTLDQAELMNSDMDYIGWSTWAQNWGAMGGIEASVVNGELVVNVTAIGEFFWSNQLFQENIVLVPNQEYTIAFDAKGDVVRDMSVVLIDANGVEFRQTLTLTTEMANYTYTFTYDGTATSGKLDFEFGNISAASVPAVITMDNITVSGSEVVNGTFDQVLAWGSWAQNWDPMGNVALTIVDGQLVADVTALGGAFWGVQLFQEGFELVPGATYTIMFDLMASVERDFNVVLIDGNGAEFRKAYNATTGMETYMYTFVYDGSSEVGKLDFEFGNISAASVPAVFTMDNIMLFRDFSNAAEVDPGTGEEPTTDWVAWGALTATAVENGTEFTYTDTPTEWWNNNAQLAVESFDGTKDAILFTFTGVLDQTYLFKIEGGGVSQEISVTATGVSQVVELPLIALSETERAGLNLIIFFATTVGGSGTALVEGWEYPAAPAPAYIGYGMDVVIGDPDVTITYTDITVGAWWTKNVQGVIDSFDGTQTSVVFNFTGEDTQTYLFKVEGNGVSREISAVADGTSQSITLDLSDLTETERAGLVLLVIFCQTEGASGTLVFHGWEYPTA